MSDARPEPEIKVDPHLLTTDERGASVPFLEPGGSLRWPIAVGLAICLLIFGCLACLAVFGV